MQSLQKNQRLPVKAKPRKINEAEFEKIVRDVSDRYSKTLEYLGR